MTSENSKQKEKQEDLNKFKPNWELTFIAENTWTASLAQYIAIHEGELPSEDILHKMMKSSVDGAIFFEKHKNSYGIHPRLTDSIEEKE